MAVTPAGEVVVVKLGGETLADQHDTLAGVADAARTRRIVLVHGGGKRLTRWLERLGIESRFDAGRRVTDEAALEVAVAVLGGLVNAELVAALQARGVDAVGLTGIDAGLVAVERVPGLGRVGRVVATRPGILEALFAAGVVPVVAPLAPDPSGAVCNVNADDIAGGLAAGLGARLVLLSDTDGVRDGDGHRIERLDRDSAEALIAAGVIAGGMVAKVRAAVEVVAGGGREVLIADGRGPDALRRALDEPGAGTRIVPRA